MNKFKYFTATLVDGSFITLKAPAGKVSEQTARKYAQHWAKMQHGIEGVDFVKIAGFDSPHGCKVPKEARNKYVKFFNNCKA